MTCTHCSSPAVAKGKCATHYQQERRGTLGATATYTTRGEGDQVVVRCPKDLKAAMTKAAKRLKLDPAEAWRLAARAWLEREAK